MDTKTIAATAILSIGLTAGTLTYYDQKPPDPIPGIHIEKVDDQNVRLTYTHPLDDVQSIASIKEYISKLDGRIASEKNPDLQALIQAERDRQAKILEAASGVGVKDASADAASADVAP